MCRYLPRSTPSMSLHATFTFCAPALRIAASAGWTFAVAMLLSSPARGLRRDPGLARCDAHVLQRMRHGLDRLFDLGAADGADAAYAKSLDLCELARVQDEAAVARGRIEGLEVVARVAGCMEGDDDRRLHARVEERQEAQPRHADDQCFVVAPVTREARGLAAFLLELRDRLGERDHHVRRRREAPLPGLFHVRVLVVQ